MGALWSELGVNTLDANHKMVNHKGTYAPTGQGVGGRTVFNILKCKHGNSSVNDFSPDRNFTLVLCQSDIAVTLLGKI